MLLRPALPLLLLGCALAAPAVAEEDFVGSGNPGHGTAAFRVEFYDNPDDGQGNPFLDESLTVVEPALVVDYDVTDRLSLNGQFSYDYVSSASIQRLSAYPEQSGASGDYYWGLDAGLNYQLDERTRVGGFGSASVEYDYISTGLGGSLSRDTADHANTFNLTGNLFYDQLKLIRYNGVQEGNDSRLSLTGSLAWYRIINRGLHGELGGTFTYQNGFLSTPFNAVVVESPGDAPNPALENMARGTEYTEVMPDTRARSTVYGQLRQRVGDRNAVGLNGRVYSDSWGIASVALEPRVYRWIVEDRVNLRLRYRYYTQSAADAYAEHFTTLEPERTQDSDLAAFHSHGAGVKFEFHLDDRWSFDILADYTVRSDGIDQIFGGSGFRRSF